MTKDKIAVIAYAFSPTRGSEYAQGWNYVLHMSKHYDLDVFVGSSDGFMGGVEEISRMKLTNGAKVNIIKMNFIGKVLTSIQRGIRVPGMFVFLLRYWNHLVVKEIERRHSIEKYTAIHHLGPVGFKTPSQFSNINIPKYWGPIGGFQYISLSLAWANSVGYYFESLLRNFFTYCFARSSFLKRAINQTDAFSFCTDTNLLNFTNLYGIEGKVLSDQAVDTANLISNMDKKVNSTLQVIWCGSVNARKNINLLIDIAKKCKQHGSAIEFHILGTGSLLKSLNKSVHVFGLDNVHVHGFVKKNEVQKYMAASDILLFTSLSEANTSTLFEGFEKLLIPIALDIDGFSRNINSKVGYRVSPDLQYEEIVDKYVYYLEQLSLDKNLVKILQKNIYSSIENYSWDNLAFSHNLIIKGIISQNAQS